MKIYKNSVICAYNLAIEAWDVNCSLTQSSAKRSGGRTVSCLLEAICEDRSSGILVEKLTFTLISNRYLCLP